MKAFLKKLTSRKFIISAIVVISGIAAGLQTSANEKIRLAGIIAAAACAIMYALTEGSIDQAAVRIATEKVISAAEQTKGETK